MTGRRWVVTLDAHPWSVNEQVRWHHHQRARTVRTWRGAFALQARAARVPALQAAVITVHTTVAKPARLHDAGNEFYAAKAAVDGLVDAGVLPDDKPAHLRALVFHAPVRGPQHRMTLTIDEVPMNHTPAPYDYALEPSSGQVVSLPDTAARALLGLLRSAPLTNPHQQRVAADLQQHLLAQGVRG